jgi:4-amino-4-deoxy-L-arabinose transferase-like glycosyltransferase
MMEAAESPVIGARSNRLSAWIDIVTAALCVVLAWGVLTLWGLDAAPFATVGEPREGLVVWEMASGGGWILPRPNGADIPSKPPLFHWLGAATALLRGEVDEWSIRFPSALMSLAGLLAVFATGTALWGVRAGLIAALSLMTMFEWSRAASNARVDMTLTVTLEVAFLSLLFFLRSRDPRWLAPLYLGMAAAILTKGPVGVVLPALTALVMFGLARDFSPLRQMRLLYGALVVLVIGGSWYAAALYVGGWEFFERQVLLENVYRLVAGVGAIDYIGHEHGVPYLAGTLVLGLLPWTVFFPGVATQLWRQRRMLTAADARCYLLVWAVVVFAFYSFSASKRSVYLLGLYPALALLLGWWWDGKVRTADGGSWWLTRLLPVLYHVLLALLLAVAAVTILASIGVPLGTWMQALLPRKSQVFGPIIADILRSERWLVLACVGVGGGAAFVAARAARAAKMMYIFASFFVVIAATVVAARLVIMPGVAERQTLRDFMADVRALVGDSANLSFYQTFSYGAVHYWRGHIPVYDGPWPQDAPRYLLMSREQWESAAPEARDSYELLASPGAGRLGDASWLVLVRRVRTR